MKTTGIIALLVVLTAGGCTKTETAAPTPPPATPNAMTPHPAQAARARAIQLYPDLAKQGSVLNQAFLEIYNHRRKHDPASLTSPDWPTDIGHRAASLLGEKSAQPGKATPSPETSKSKKTATPLNQASPLNKAAYDRKEAFVDTDRDGRAFDFKQPPR